VVVLPDAAAAAVEPRSPIRHGRRCYAHPSHNIRPHTGPILLEFRHLSSSSPSWNYHYHIQWDTNVDVVVAMIIIIVFVSMVSGDDRVAAALYDRRSGGGGDAQHHHSCPDDDWFTPNQKNNNHRTHSQLVKFRLLPVERKTGSCCALGVMLVYSQFSGRNNVWEYTTPVRCVSLFVLNEKK
jgi:hypothetical protein